MGFARAYMRPVKWGPVRDGFRLCDLGSSFVTGWWRGQAPQPRSGAPKAQGLRAPATRDSFEKIACRLVRHSCVCLSCRFQLIQGEPCWMHAALAAPTYIRSGFEPVPRSLMQHCEGVQGSKGNGTILNRGIFQPCSVPGHTFALDLTNSSSCYSSFHVLPAHQALRTAPCGITPVSR
jgi:hypothetical protein